MTLEKGEVMKERDSFSDSVYDEQMHLAECVRLPKEPRTIHLKVSAILSSNCAAPIFVV